MTEVYLYDLNTFEEFDDSMADVFEEHGVDTMMPFAREGDRTEFFAMSHIEYQLWCEWVRETA